MIDQEKIKNKTEEFFGRMGAIPSNVEAGLSVEEEESVNIDVTLDEPQMFIGQGGQMLLEIQRILRMVLNKKAEQPFHINLDINGYKRKKVEYLKNVAKELANEVALAKQEKELPPMSSYERRVVHAELAQRTDVQTESRGEGLDRHIVIKPKEFSF